MKLRYKVIVLNVLALLATLIILGPIIITITDDNNLSTNISFLEGQGNYAVNYAEQYILNKAHTLFEIPKVIETDASYLCAVIERTAKCRVQIFNGGVVIGDSSDSFKQRDLRLEITAALDGGTAYYIDGKSNRTLYFATPLDISAINNYAIGFIQDLSPQDILRDNMIRLFVGASIISMAFVGIISIQISKKITDPLDKLYNATQSFSSGDLKRRINITSNDEVGELSSAFNKMAESIGTMIETIKDEQNKQKIFFDNFTHEIRTPLTTIIGYTDLLWKTDNEEIKDKSLYYISSESKRMLKMIENLLNLSRLKKYNFNLHLADTDLSKVIRFVCDAMIFKANRYHIEIRLNLEEIHYTLDPDLFEQVLINLIDNSIKYSNTNLIDIALWEKSNEIFLTIKDYGCGIVGEDLANVFEPYYKVEKSRNSSNDGNGLGLAIVKEIIDIHNAEIIIDSKLNVGTKVMVVFKREGKEK